MKKILSFMFLIMSGMQYATAETLQNMDTPVNWSYSAIFNTIMELYDDTYPTYGHKYMLAEKLFSKYYDEKQAVSARWICENYITFAREEGLEAKNCYDVIAKIIDNHNKEVHFGTLLKPIDKFQPENLVFWNPSAVMDACSKYADIYEEKLHDALSHNPRYANLKTQTISGTWIPVAEAESYEDANKTFKICRDLKYNGHWDIYDNAHSINDLVGYCKNNMFGPVLGYKFTELCSSWIDDVINYHNEHVRDIKKISGSVK